MAEGKKSFIVYTSWKMWLDGLTKEQKGIWLDWMMDYCNDLNPDYPQDQAVMIACMMAKDTLKRDLKKYEERKERMKTARNLNPNNNKELLSNSNQTEIKQISVNNQSNISSDNVNVNVNDNVNVNVLDKSNINKVSKDTMSSKLADACLEIINYLNLKTNKNFKPNAKATQDFIKARLKDGYSIDDFKKVIDNKCYQWLGTEQEQYLRPETLFRPSHFESYLNEVIKSGVKNNPCDLPNGGFESLDDRPAPSEEELERWRNEVNF